MRPLRLFARLSWSERRRLIETILLVWAVRISLSSFGYAKTRNRFLKGRATEAFSPDFIAWSVQQASKVTPGATCLVQGLAVQYLLERSGFRSDLRIGARRRPDDKFEAHAWVVLDGRVVIGGTVEELATYGLLVDLPAQQ
jgi:hypothetical protein